MTQPEKKTNHTTFSVDFGSAPVDAFFRLLGALEEADVREVEVGSFHLFSGQD